MITPAPSLPIEIAAPDAPVPDEAIQIIASLLLDAVEAEDATVGIADPDRQERECSSTQESKLTEV